MIGSVNERIEDLNESVLKTSIDASILEKKGILHQYANNCEIGWIKDYKARIVSYIKEKDKNGN